MPTIQTKIPSEEDSSPTFGEFRMTTVPPSRLWRDEGSHLKEILPPRFARVQNDVEIIKGDHQDPAFAKAGSWNRWRVQNDDYPSVILPAHLWWEKR
ncbi:hypothetical protein COT52_01525 [candidate division WWE3 bacterium CG08_land_8_20_14_0_20_43_13]|uniref:Uncharacterized protein n=1 Tax=candidate division WWE3 bacterium CG08_land_8_20_14_0_20_43_13 TaxID=1975087 RepID=A0A2H0X7H0_UNCKA|nr:MAG: hypothetical protein COT52_01525 [candidate division WWE3 bacterium CG08_land_8_20_14_0_20_43_13]